jgi:hypothetical protein
MRNFFQKTSLFIIIFTVLQEKANAECLTNCLDCTTDPLQCDTCKPNFFLTEDKKSCLAKCPDKFFGDKNAGTCVADCPSLFTGDTTKRTCEPCPEKCDTCSYYGGKVNCVKCTSPANLNLPTMSCTDTCKPNSEWVENLDTNSTCRSCIDSNVKNCSTCSSSTACTSCPINFYNISDSSGAVQSCTSCTDIGGRLGCTKCSFKNQVVNCLACMPGYSFLDGEGGICIACGENCEQCTKDRCTKCKTNTFPLYPNYKQCTVCTGASQTKQQIPGTSDTACVYNPIPVAQLGRVRFDEFEKVQAAMYSNICEDQGSLANNHYSVYYVCSLNEGIINSITTIDQIKINLPNNLEVSKPDYTDKDSKFWGQSKNNTIVCPGRANGYYYLRYFCENEFKTLSAASQTVKYRIPLSEGRQTQLLLTFDRNLTEVQREDLLCTLETLFALKGKFLVRTPKGIR